MIRNVMVVGRQLLPVYGLCVGGFFVETFVTKMPFSQVRGRVTGTVAQHLGWAAHDPRCSAFEKMLATTRGMNLLHRRSKVLGEVEAMHQSGLNDTDKSIIFVAVMQWRVFELSDASA